MMENVSPILQKASTTLHAAPILPESWLMMLGLAVIATFLFSLILYKRGAAARLVVSIVFLGVFLGPALLKEKREMVKDVAVIVVDRSSSQQLGERTSRTNMALESLKEKLQNQSNLDLRIVEAPAEKTLPLQETRLFDALDNIMSDVSPQRRAGVIFLTDGLVHDIPEDHNIQERYGPVHVLLSGEHDEKDRQVIITEAPSYGIVGQNVTLRYIVEDTGNTGEEYASVILRQDNDRDKLDLVPVGEEQSLNVTINHAGQNIIEIEVASLEDEITDRNNRVPVIINGVRDRLRVLLVSGLPYAGERTWRNLLTSDPGVDLVHFTILREPSKLDVTPQNELSLIAFPFRELFEEKLYDFDLIIFDRYRLNRIMPNYYFSNIARYVEKGGALLVTSGPAFSGPDSIYTTSLKDILPAYPSGEIMEQRFKPTLTTTGHKHPVTQNLNWSGRKGTDNNPGWGSWMRQVRIVPQTGDILMTGESQAPLLVLDHVGEGRIAQLASDQIWLWSRGYEGGGPQADLLRRLAHWLMKEPDLEENALDVQIDGSALVIRRRSLDQSEIPVRIVPPDGPETSVLLKKRAPDGWLEERVNADTAGIYKVTDDLQSRFAIVGDINPKEFRHLVSTEAIMEPIASQTGGTTLWLEDHLLPDVRLLPASSRSYGGKDWIGLRRNNAYNVSGVEDMPLMPDWVYAVLLLSLMVAMWGLEGRKKQD